MKTKTNKKQTKNKIKNIIQRKTKKNTKKQKGGITPMNSPRQITPIRNMENITNNREMRNRNRSFQEITSPSFISTPSDDENSEYDDIIQDYYINDNVNRERGRRRRGDSFDELVSRLDFSETTSSPNYNEMFIDELGNDDSFISSDSNQPILIPGTRAYEVISEPDPVITEKLDTELSEKLKNIPKDKVNIDMKKTVMDYINDEETTVEEFLKQNIDNIVIRDENENYYFVNKETIKNNQETSDLFVCIEATLGWVGDEELLLIANTNFPLYNMNSIGIENYVFKPDIDKLLNENNKEQQYYIIPTKTDVPSTVSRPMLEIYKPNATSANHCQIGKGGKVFRLISITDFNQSNSRGGKSYKQKQKTRKLKNIK
jgi:hypothetical protein